MAQSVEGVSTQRYARQIALPGFGQHAQDRLRAARVLVIGAGGLGSTVIPALAAAGVGTLGIIDDDTVELSNLHRQLIHGIGDVGSPKTVSAAAAISGTEAVVHQYRARLRSTNALALFADYDLVVDGSDNFPTRYLANDAAELAGIPLVWGAVSQYSGQAGVAWHERGPGYRDLFPTPPSPGSVLSCEAGGVLPTTVAVIGSILTNEVIKILTGIGAPLIGRVTTFDALGGGFRELAYDRDPHAAPVTGLIDYELFCGFPAHDQTVTASALAAELNGAQPPLLLDVREQWESDLVSLPGALLVPLGQLQGAIDQIDHDRTIVVYCHAGVRSASALEQLRASGFANARHLDGGIDAWAREVDHTMARY